MSGNLGNKQVMSQNIKRLMRDNQIDRKTLSENLDVKYTTLSDWINAVTYPRIDKIEKMARYFNVTKSDLIEPYQPQSPNPDLSKYGIISLENRRTKKIPILGEVACGVPIYAEETYNDYIEVDEDIKVDFALRTKGDSMIGDNIVDGDVVLVKKVSMVEPHEIAVVIINDEATLKRVKYDRANNIVMLIASNYSIAPIIYSGEELEQINILGKVVLLQRKL